MQTAPALRTSSAAPVTGEPAAPSFSPLYQQIKALLLHSLQAGEWRAGDLIPSEMELAARYKVSQGTVRKAVDALTAENLLRRQQGKGTFVATHTAKQAQYRFLRLQPDAVDGSAQNPTPLIYERVFPVCKSVVAPASVAKDLALAAGSKVKYVVRVMSSKGEPKIFEEIWLPEPAFALLSSETLGNYVGPIYGLFESAFGMTTVRAAERIKAVLPSKDAQKYLQISAATPVLAVERVSYTYDDTPMELRRACYLTQGFHYQNRLV